MIDESQMQHGRHWSGQSVRGWLATEKYRGCRAYWDGLRLWSRGGLEVKLPEDFRAELPGGFALDGEIWAGRGPANGECEQEAAAAIKQGKFTPRLRFMVFDAPGVAAPWLHRISAAAVAIGQATRVAAVGFTAVQSLPHLEKLYGEVVAKAGEGLMLYDPRPACYQPRRVRGLLKLKIDPALARGVLRYAA